MTQERLSYAYGTSSQPLLGMTIGEKFDQACLLRLKRASF